MVIASEEEYPRQREHARPAARVMRLDAAPLLHPAEDDPAALAVAERLRCIEVAVTVVQFVLDLRTELPVAIAPDKGRAVVQLLIIPDRGDQHVLAIQREEVRAFPH